jgi:pyruvate formate lyase activating enzyme
MGSGADYEFRTTVVPGLVDLDDMEKIGAMVSGARAFSIQQFRNDKTYDELYKKVTPYTDEKIAAFGAIMGRFTEKVRILNTAMAV